jgi:hypothetical protein
MSRFVNNLTGDTTGNVSNGRVTVKGNRNNHQYQNSPVQDQTDTTVASLMEAESNRYQVTATTSGVSAGIDLPGDTDYILRFVCDSGFVVDVQEGYAPSGDYDDLYYDATTQATIDSSTGPQSLRVTGGHGYRMDVTTYNADITMTAYKVYDNAQ